MKLVCQSKRTYVPKFILLSLIIFLTGCGSRTDLAPVEELRWQPQRTFQAVHRVKKGETLYAIAFRYETDYRQLARLNHLQSPYSLRIGQVLRVRGVAMPRSFKPSRPYKPQSPPKIHPPISYTKPSRGSFFHFGSSSWLWPSQGRVVANFVPQQGKKGIDIAGRKGEKIHASSGGTVAYAGSGLAGYGNLIIIKHDNQFLTAYGNNAKNLVKEGQKVKAGQIIAEMGIIDRRFWGVHFEIRKSGIPVNPLSYLKK